MLYTPHSVATNFCYSSHSIIILLSPLVCNDGVHTTPEAHTPEGTHPEAPLLRQKPVPSGMTCSVFCGANWQGILMAMRSIPGGMI